MHLISQNFGSSETIGNCPAMQKLYALMACVPASAATALLPGETGPGKEQVARAMHHHSLRGESICDHKLRCAASLAN